VADSFAGARDTARDEAKAAFNDVTKPSIAMSRFIHLAPESVVKRIRRNGIQPTNIRG